MNGRLFVAAVEPQEEIQWLDVGRTHSASSEIPDEPAARFDVRAEAKRRLLVVAVNRAAASVFAPYERVRFGLLPFNKGVVIAGTDKGLKLSFGRPDRTARYGQGSAMHLYDQFEMHGVLTLIRLGKWVPVETDADKKRILYPF